MPILELHRVAKHFGAIHALNDVNLCSKPGEVLGLMGDNGAGKSTLVEVIAGNFPPTHGEILHRRRGRAFLQAGGSRATRASRSSTRTSRSATTSSAAANVFLGREIKRRLWPVPRLDHAGDGQARRRIVQRAEIGDAAARSRAADVGRPAAGGRHRAHAAVEGAAWC